MSPRYQHDQHDGPSMDRLLGQATEPLGRFWAFQGQVSSASTEGQEEESTPPALPIEAKVTKMRPHCSKQIGLELLARI